MPRFSWPAMVVARRLIRNAHPSEPSPGASMASNPAAPTATATAPASPVSSVTWRAVLTGAVLVFAISVISPWAVLVVKGSQLTSNAIPIIVYVPYPDGTGLWPPWKLGGDS
jgi:hypothetical protein